MGVLPAAATPVLATWDIFLFLPNIIIPVPTPFDGIEIRICAGNDPILGSLSPAPANTTAQQMLGAFRSQFGATYLPACLIVRTGAPATFRRQQTIRAFRNVCAVATIVTGYTGTQWHPRYSDHFDVYPLAPATGGGIVTNDAIVQGIHAAAGFMAQASPLIQKPTNFQCAPAQNFLTNLILAWKHCFVFRRNRPALLPIFRSIDIALHALRFPTDGLLGTQDAGLRIVLWVSAFETLLNPGAAIGGVDLRTVLQFLAGLPWKEKTLRRRAYKVADKRVKRLVTKAEAIYGDLYKARNDFIHGNKIQQKRLWFRESRQEQLLSQVAPLVYWACLEEYLKLFFPGAQAAKPPAADISWLRTPAGRKYMVQRAAEWAQRGNAEAALAV